MVNYYAHKIGYIIKENEYPSEEEEKILRMIEEFNQCLKEFRKYSMEYSLNLGLRDEFEMKNPSSFDKMKEWKKYSNAEDKAYYEANELAHKCNSLHDKICNAADKLNIKYKDGNYTKQNWKTSVQQSERRTKRNDDAWDEFGIYEHKKRKPQTKKGKSAFRSSESQGRSLINGMNSISRVTLRRFK